LNIAFIGDIALTGLLSQNSKLNHIRFSEIRNKLQVFNVVFANLETPVKIDDSINEYKKFIHYSFLDPTRDALKMLNVSCVSLANNHIYDCKMSGLKATINMLDQIGVRHTGAGWMQEHIQPVILKTENKRIAFLAFVDQSTNPKTENFPELFINYFNVDKVINEIKNVKAIADKVIVSIHWGVDYSFYPTQNQIQSARTLIEAGADVIMGHHPHTFQPFEKYKNGYIFYSLGGLTFGDYMKNGKMQALFRKTKKSAIVSYQIENTTVSFISVKELKGNFIQITNRNYFKWSHKMWVLHRMKNASPLIKRLFIFYEKVIYRIYEYFFGYYQNPIKRLFQFSNLKKIQRLFREFKAQDKQ
jgi:poly-gamma-glutamate synthesis protein (capsule biosynthesis protein)